TCDQVVLIAGGEVLYAGALESLLAGELGIYELRVRGTSTAMKQALEMRGWIVTESGATLEVRRPSDRGPEAILAVAIEAGQQVRHLAPLTQTLERAFLSTLAQAGHAAAEGA